jgi:hypothetical protein
MKQTSLHKNDYVVHSNFFTRSAIGQRTTKTIAFRLEAFILFMFQVMRLCHPPVPSISCCYFTKYIMHLLSPGIRAAI